jgi:hypothetical protein
MQSTGVVTVTGGDFNTFIGNVETTHAVNWGSADVGGDNTVKATTDTGATGADLNI